MHGLLKLQKPRFRMTGDCQTSVGVIDENGISGK